MAFGSRSDFVEFIKPLGTARLKLYDPSRSPHDQPQNTATDPAKAIPQGFLDAMSVRENVFTQEQHIPHDHDFDSDDARSFQWVVYASIPSKTSEPLDGSHATKSTHPDRRTSTKLPIGTIRLVPPPHAPHPPSKRQLDTSGTSTAAASRPVIKPGDVHEPWLKLSRLSIIKEFRKTGISRLLVETALKYARDHPYDMTPPVDPSKAEALRQEHHVGTEFKGLILVHSQIGAQKVWQKLGFMTDESMGVWEEEGIEHVGMWKRVDVTSGRRASKVTLPSSAVLGQ